MATSKIAKTYEKKSEKQHILDTPDTYIGSIENVEEPLWIYNEERDRIEHTVVHYTPALYKLFDEVIINARDHIVRIITQQNVAGADASQLKNVSYINIEVANDGKITITNDGNGIDIVEHPEHKVWIPELIFAHLRTSTNYNKEEKRIVGGKNGFGVKLVFIWSVWGEIETIDHIRGLKYNQVFERNLDIIGKPTITKVKGISARPFTRISFMPDYARFGLVDGLTPEMVALFKKRAYDIAGVSDHSVKKVVMKYNGDIIPVRNFGQYIDSYIGNEKRIYEESGSRWEYGVSMSGTGEFMQVSFVNGICTYKGGKHVDYIMGQITRKLVEYIETKKKIKVSPSSIKEQLMLFLRCDIENPVFGSQTKDYLDLPSNKFGSLPSVSDTFIEKLAKLGVMATACAITQVKEEKNAKKTDGSKSRVVRGIDNFDDANLAGGVRSKECTLLLCEGLSAKSGVISGIKSEDRAVIGIYPMKGKLLNVRGESVTKVGANKEIGDLKRILGLETGKVYKDVTALRYGKVVILTDADMDGHHIKGLILNAFETLWPSLLAIPGFLSFMNTPILRATPKTRKMGEPILFYNNNEYELWKNSGVAVNQYSLKYFKGLGTSTAVEFKQYFENKKYVDFIFNGKSSSDCVDKVFNKKRPDDRKLWLENYDKDAYLNTSNTTVLMEEFIDRELIHFSNYDCQRSIPNMVDGLKISQRKILYVAFRRNLTEELKVAQFSAAVSEVSHYHHGENSLVGAIVGMAQDFVGSNNLHLFEPKGQFGSRLQLGGDHASERYIFTHLSPITRKVFPAEDDAILHYLNDDGFMIEPQYYVPIIPFVLLNGVKGIGTGFSTNIEPHNPLDVLKYLVDKLKGVSMPEVEFIPFYQGFLGTVEKVATNRFYIKGCYAVNGDTVIITELPIGQATDPYKEYLEKLADGSTDKDGKKIAPVIKDFTNLSTDKTVNITVVFPKGEVDKLMKQGDSPNGLEKLLKLTTTVSHTNMHLFKADLKLHRYESIEEIIDDFMVVRLQYYEIRKRHLIAELDALLVKLSNRAKYIQLCLKGTIDLRRKREEEINTLLSSVGLVTIDDTYDYLVKMAMNSVSAENVERILKEEADTRTKLAELHATTLEMMWLCELDAFSRSYEKYRETADALQKGIVIKKKARKNAL